MPRAIAYHRPDSVEDAVALLNDSSHQPLAGGTVLNGDDDPTPPPAFTWKQKLELASKLMWVKFVNLPAVQMLDNFIGSFFMCVCFTGNIVNPYVPAS